MSNSILTLSGKSLGVMSSARVDFTGQVYNSGTDATSGANVRTDFYDRAAIKVAVEDLIYGAYADGKTQQRNSGKTFKISRFRHILRDANDSNQGIDGAGNVIASTDWIFNNIAYADEATADAAKVTYDATAIGIAEIAANVEKTVFSVVSSGGSGSLYGGSRNVGDVSSGMPSLSEGASEVNRVGVTRENFSATLFRRGAFNEYTDEVMLFSDHDMQMEYRTKLARAAIEMKDDDVQLGMLGAAGLRVYSGSATSLVTMGTGGEVAGVSYDLSRKMTKQLKKNLAVRNTEMVTGSTKYATTPINSAYYGICSPEVVYDLESVAEFRAVHEYAAAANLAKNEIGSLHEVRFIESLRALSYEGMGAADTTNTQGYASTGGFFDVHPILFPTKGSYATVGLQGKGAITFKSKAPGEIGQSDKYGVKGLFSFNYFHAGLALQPEKLGVMYVCVSA